MPPKKQVANKYHPESCVLDPERECHHKRGSDTLVVRTITQFHFEDIKSGEPIAPLWEMSTPAFWEGVRLKGVVGPLVGKARNLFQAGYWDVMCEGVHFEMMEIKGITGMFLEKDKSWRNGVEDILWIHTSKYAYALQVPLASYEDSWNRVVLNWEKSHPGCLAMFRPVSANGDRPGWWKKAEERQWKKLLEVHGPSLRGKGKSKERENVEDSDDGDNGDDDDDDDKGDGSQDHDDDDDDNEETGLDRTKASGSVRAKGTVKTTLRTRSTRGRTKATRGAGGQRSTRSSVGRKGKEKALPESEPEPEPEPERLSVPSRRKRPQVVVAPSLEGTKERSRKRVRIAHESVSGPSSYAESSVSAVDGSAGVKRPPPDSTAADALAENSSNPQHTTGAAPSRSGDDSTRSTKKARVDSADDDAPSKDPVAGPSTRPPSNGEASPPSAIKKIVPAAEWAARRRESIRAHEEMRASGAGEEESRSSEKTPAPEVSGSTKSASSSPGPFPPPTSSPVTAINAWTTRPLTQVAPASQSSDITGGNGGAGGSEADMSLDSNSVEGTAALAEENPAPLPQAGNAPPAQNPVIAHAKETLSDARRLISEIESRAQPDPMVPQASGGSNTGTPATTSSVRSPDVVMAEAAAACASARETLERFSGGQHHPEPSSKGEASQPAQRRNPNDPAPVVVAEENAPTPAEGSGTSRIEANVSPERTQASSPATGRVQPLPVPRGDSHSARSTPSVTTATSLTPPVRRELPPVASTSRLSAGTSSDPDQIERRMRVLDITLQKRDKRPATEKRVASDLRKP